jgi:hypothetical protein
MVMLPRFEIVGTVCCSRTAPPRGTVVVVDRTLQRAIAR